MQDFVGQQGSEETPGLTTGGPSHMSPLQSTEKAEHMYQSFKLLHMVTNI